MYVAAKGNVASDVNVRDEIMPKWHELFEYGGNESSIYIN